MRRVSTSDPQRVEYHGGGGWPAIIGFPILCIGISVVVLGLSDAAGHLGSILLVLLGLAQTAAGGVLLFWRHGLELDLAARTWRRWWRFLIPLRSRGGSLDDLKLASVDLERRRNSDGSYTVFPVRLRGLSRTIAIDAPRNYEKARRGAQDLARALHLPLVDSTSGETVTRRPDELDESLRERARRLGTTWVSVADPSPGMSSRFEVDGCNVKFIIPSADVLRKRLLRSVPFLVLEILLVLCVQWILPGGLGPRGLWLFAVSAVQFHLVLRPAMAAQYGVFQSHTVEASPESIRLETMGFLGRTRATEIPSDEVEDLTAGDAITIRSDARTISFGAHLSREEKAWIRDILEGVLTA